MSRPKSYLANKVQNSLLVKSLTLISQHVPSFDLCAAVLWNNNTLININSVKRESHPGFCCNIYQIFMNERKLCKKLTKYYFIIF